MRSRAAAGCFWPSASPGSARAALRTSSRVGRSSVRPVFSGGAAGKATAPLRTGSGRRRCARTPAPPTRMPCARRSGRTPPSSRSSFRSSTSSIRSFLLPRRAPASSSSSPSQPSCGARRGSRRSCSFSTTSTRQTSRRSSCSSSSRPSSPSCRSSFSARIGRTSTPIRPRSPNCGACPHGSFGSVAWLQPK